MLRRPKGAVRPGCPMPLPNPPADVSADAAADGLAALLAPRGHCFVEAAEMHALLKSAGDLADWGIFAASWDGMPVDRYMADGGRYRRRRHAVFTAPATGPIRRQPHQPHFQGLEYNPLNGGIERWFEPIPDAIGQGSSLTTILAFCRRVFGRLAPRVPAWHVEVHQFRIEAVEGAEARPTPEGVHRDGVDYVLVLLIRRVNLLSGTTTIHEPGGGLLGSFTLATPFDATLIDDARVHHGVTPVRPLRTGEPAYRDVLVVTFRVQPGISG